MDVGPFDPLTQKPRTKREVNCMTRCRNMASDIFQDGGWSKRNMAVQGHVFWGQWKGDKGQNNAV